MTAIPTQSIKAGLSGIRAGASEMFGALAQKTRAGLGHADGVIKQQFVDHKTIGGIAKHHFKERPATALAVTGATVAGTAFVGANMAHALGGNRGEARGR